MPVEPYTREVVDLKLNAIIETGNDILTVAKEARDQARITNGRVTALEKNNEKRAGGNVIILAVGIPMLAILVGYLSWMGVKVSNIDYTISKAVEAELSKYEVKISPQ